jgi:hypothetical protein
MNDPYLHVQCRPTYRLGTLAEHYTVHSCSTYSVLWTETGHMITIDVRRVTAGYQHPFSGQPFYVQLVPVAARSKTWVCGRSLTGTVGLNPAGGMDVCLLRLLCVVR